MISPVTREQIETLIARVDELGARVNRMVEDQEGPTDENQGLWSALSTAEFTLDLADRMWLDQERQAGRPAVLVERR